MNEELLFIKNLTVEYSLGKYNVRAVDNVSLKINKGISMGIAGESGSGKTTLALSILKLLPHYARILSGEIIFEGKNILNLANEEIRKIRGAKIGMIFQDPSVSLNPTMKVIDHFIEFFNSHRRNLRKEEIIEEAAKILEEMGIGKERLKDYPHMLSGGMKQRVAIGLALALNPPLLIADEPTTALDVLIEAQIIELLKNLKKQRNISIMLITHNLGIISELADEVSIMYAGKIVEIGSKESIFNDPLHPYTQLLLQAIPEIGIEKKLKAIPGLPPDLSNPPAGCRFHPRCPFAMEICKKVEPELIEIKPNHYVACHLYEK
jgi:peptide/nickel transport system ATP-binding protein